jgi:hypothetical protein
VLLSPLTLRLVPLVDCFFVSSCPNIILTETLAMAEKATTSLKKKSAMAAGESDNAESGGAEGGGEGGVVSSLPAYPFSPARAGAMAGSTSDVMPPLPPPSMRRQLSLGSRAGEPFRTPLRRAVSAPSSAISSAAPYSQLRGNNSNHLHLLDDADSVERLAVFAENNKGTLNALLRQNIRLIEGPFLPLLLLPECRKILDFHVKRSYLKLKLKRHVRKATRRHSEEDEDGSDEDDDNESEDSEQDEEEDDEDPTIEVDVARDRVLESSFEALRDVSRKKVIE